MENKREGWTRVKGRNQRLRLNSGAIPNLIWLHMQPTKASNKIPKTQAESEYTTLPTASQDTFHYHQTKQKKNDRGCYFYFINTELNQS